jgi:RNA polymerase sigma-70 factor, ECF subfamily
VVLQADGGTFAPGASRVVRGAQKVARGALAFSGRAAPGVIVRRALVNGAAGIVAWLPDGRPLSVLGFTVARGKIVEIDILSDPDRLRSLVTSTEFRSSY